ncbi:MAG: putative alpha/beta-fold hydrolase [Cyclobacteriaceae bacterium]|jgi:predicted alpha/beta-fold hydrolase
MINLHLPTYKAPKVLFNGHLQTIVPALTRKIVVPFQYARERIVTPDDDFLDLDWLASDQKKLIILNHGLEGNSSRPYIFGMAVHLFQQGYDVLAWNYRGCSGEMNRAKRMYHSGATDDLDFVIQHASKKYDAISLVGFSLGGNLTLKYLGEQKAATPIKCALTFSVPLDLHDGVKYLDQGLNRLYAKRFLGTLFDKVKQKHTQYPDLIDLDAMKQIKSLFDFDDTYTSKLHGFSGAVDYYTQCSSINFIDTIAIPTLIVNAKNDPMIGRIALQEGIAEGLSKVQFHLEAEGGHCGFSRGQNQPYWSEEVAVRFLNEFMS